MKTIKVSKNTHPATFRKCKNFGQLIAAIEHEGEGEGLFVVSVVLNDKKMDSEDEKLLDRMSINEVTTAEFTMKTMQEIVRDSMVEIISALQDIQKRAVTFSNEFRTNNKVDVEKVKFVLIQCRTVIQNLEEIFQSHNKNKFRIKHLSLWLETEKELTNILHCILQSRFLSNAQFVADLIEFDLTQSLDRWVEVLEKELLDNPSFSGIFSLNKKKQSSDNGLDA